jgi:hypothetical protein
MRKSKGVFIAFTLAIIVNGLAVITVVAQDKDKKQEESTTNVLRPAIGYIGAPMIFGSAFGGVVKDVPFSAEMVSESIQILYDGNRIVSRSTTVMYRDSQGRTRNEFSFKPLLQSGNNIEHKSVSISDPVSGVTYMLDPQNRIAHKYTIPQGVNAFASYSTAGAVTYQSRVTTSKGIKAENPTGSQGARSFESLDAKVSSSPKPSPFFSLPEKLEPLGKQMIEGVEADGTRMIQIIPAGAMGNERPMEVTHERWYSPELQMHVLTKTSDPRSGESTQRLTNLIRSEPDASLFQPPSDYTIREVETSGLLMKEVPEKKPRDSNDK